MTKFNLNDHIQVIDSYAYHSLLETPLDLEVLGLINPALTVPLTGYTYAAC